MFAYGGGNAAFPRLGPAAVSRPRFAAFELQIPECLHVVVTASVPGGDARSGAEKEQGWRGWKRRRRRKKEKSEEEEELLKRKWRGTDSSLR